MVDKNFCNIAYSSYLLTENSRNFHLHRKQDFCNRFSVVDVWSMKKASTTSKNLNVMRLCVFVVVWSKKQKTFFFVYLRFADGKFDYSLLLL